MPRAETNHETVGGLVQIENMSHEALELYPGTDTDLAIIASQDPDRLGDVLDDAAKEELELKQVLCAAESTYETELSESGASTTEALRLATVDVIEAEKDLEEIKPAADLASGVRSTREQLASPMRTTAIILSALVIGLGSATYEVETNPDVYKDVPAKKANNYGDLYTKSPAAIAIIMGIMGGVGGKVMGAVMTPYEARRRARKIIRKAGKTSTD